MSWGVRDWLGAGGLAFIVAYVVVGMYCMARLRRRWGGAPDPDEQSTNVEPDAEERTIADAIPYWDDWVIFPDAEDDEERAS